MMIRSAPRCRRLNSTILAIAAAAALFCSPAARGQQPDDAAEAAAGKVPVKRVVLFSSGVGYFEHQGQLDGDATLELRFNVDDVNDLLKSMVLQDLGGGKISTVTYGSRDPITKTLRTFGIDLTSNPTLAQLLSQIRGETVLVEAPTKIDGKIVGVETQKQPAGENQVVDVQYLNLLTDEGLRRIPLDSIGRIKLANPELDAELRQALQVLATGHATDKKTVSLQFLGQGKRDVRVGYVQEAPVWKTSYRLVLDEKEKPFLQGWAIVENTTDTDWNDVRLSLVSGRPISFVMDLYSPLYAPRPVVVPELYASLRPKLYGQDLSARKAEFEAREKEMLEESSAEFGRTTEGPASAPASQRAGLARAGVGIGGRAFSTTSLADRGLSSDALQQSVQAAAQAGDVGELFRYDIATPVTLPRQRSAMLPIVNDSIEGEKLSIYNPSVHAKHPLNGIRVKNSSDLHLMQGPMTVFDGGIYAGDARIPDLPSGSERLISYALDLDVEVAPTSDARPKRLVSVRIEKGVLLVTHQLTRTQNYTIRNSGDDAKTLLIEHRIQPQWKLVAPQEPAEKTRDMYRFAVAAKPGEPAELKIEEQQTIHQNVAISKLPERAIEAYLSTDVVSDAVKDALREVIRRKAELADLHRQKQQFEQQIATIGQEQDRIRNNMRSITRNSDLYNRYVTKFTEQEDRIEQLHDDIRALEHQITTAQKELDDYLSTLDLGK